MEKESLDILHKANLKATTPRLTVLKVFAGTHLPINADHIYQKVKRLGINEATVYRTLTSFEEAGIVKRVDLRKDSLYYELASGHHHHHIVCTDCGTIEDFEACQIGKVSDKVLAQSSKFSVIKEHSLELFGTCNVCIKK
jgi:Fur family ferric uptake transcriptional regulator